jgi:DNA-binding phage protein
MVLTRDFKTTIMERAKRDPKFSKAMLADALNELLAGDVDLGKAILRDYVNATVSFEVLAKSLDKNPKSLMRMLSPRGNPTSRFLFGMLHAIQKLEHINIRITISNL